MIDSHIHLHQYDQATLHNKIEQWINAGVKRVIAVSNNLASSYETVELHMKFPSFVSACIGFHPEYPLPSYRDVEEWKSLIQAERNRITAIGEIGLPHYTLDQLPDSLEQHIEMLREYIHVAHTHQLPVALHAVHDKAEIVLSLLKEGEIKQAHFHWLKAPLHVVKGITSAGYFISVTPEVCYRERDQQLAAIVPIDQLLIETDGPWKYDGNFHTHETTPLFLREVIRELAYIKGVNEEELSLQLIRNAFTCYNLQSSDMQ